MIKIRKLNDDGTEFRVSQYTQNSKGIEIFVWSQRMTRKEFSVWLKEQFDTGKINKTHWREQAGLMIKYTKVPVCFDDRGKMVSGIIYGANA